MKSIRPSQRAAGHKQTAAASVVFATCVPWQEVRMRLKGKGLQLVVRTADLSVG